MLSYGRQLKSTIQYGKRGFILVLMYIPSRTDEDEYTHSEEESFRLPFAWTPTSLTRLSGATMLP